MPGLGPGIHVKWAPPVLRPWMAGTSPAMTGSWAGSLQQRQVAVEDVQDFVAALIGDFEDGAVDAGFRVFPQRRLVGRGAEHRGRDGARIATLFLRHAVQPRQLLADLDAAAGAREPAIAILDD